MDLDAIRAQCASLSSRIDVLEAIATGSGNRAFGGSALEVEDFTKDVLLSNFDTVRTTTARKSTLTVSQENHNPDERRAHIVELCISVVRIIAGFVFGAFFLIVLTTAYFLTAHGLVFAKGILPLLAGISLAFSFAAFTGAAGGNVSVKASSGQGVPATPTAKGKFTAAFTGSLVGFSLGVLAGLLVDFFR